MSDRRLRDLDRAMSEEGTVDSVVAWAMEAHRSGLRSNLRCRKCHGCETCTAVVSACKACGGSGYAALEDSVVVGSVLRDAACETLAGWKPVKKFKENSPLGAFDYQGVERSRAPTWIERAKTLTGMFPEALNRTVVALAEENLARDPSEPRTRVVRLLRAWAAEPCPVRAKKRYLTYTADSQRVRCTWLPHSDSSAALHYVVDRQARTLGHVETIKVLGREVVPWLLGRGDPLRDRMDRETQ